MSSVGHPMLPSHSLPSSTQSASRLAREGLALGAGIAAGIWMSGWVTPPLALELSRARYLELSSNCEEARSNWVALQSLLPAADAETGQAIVRTSQTAAESCASLEVLRLGLLDWGVSPLSLNRLDAIGMQRAQVSAEALQGFLER